MAYEMVSLLRMLIDREGSDLHLAVDNPPCGRVHGSIIHFGNLPLTPEDTERLMKSIASVDNQQELQEVGGSDFGFAFEDIARFRVSIFKQRGHVGLVLRIIPRKISTMEELGLPLSLRDIINQPRGLILVTGPTGSGKSTSLAAMIDWLNTEFDHHIITIEDPIEFYHNHKKSIITQREVGVDTESYGIALKNTLRQAPDVILIGEIRDRETMEHAITFAETGHLCLSTLHANSTNQALDRIINFFPDERRSQLLMDLSLNLKGLIAQRLIPKIDGVGRIPAIEIMLNTPLMADMIFKGEVVEMKSLIAKSNEAGMQTFDQALFDLYEERKITFEDALRNADSVNDIRLRIKLESDTARKAGIVEDHRDFELEESDDGESGGLV